MTLEQFRKHSIEELQNNSFLLKNIIRNTIKREFDLYIIGSVLNKKEFTEDSDIDIGVFIYDDKISNGPNENLTEKLRDILLNVPFDFGNVDVIVFNNTTPKGTGI